MVDTRSIAVPNPIQIERRAVSLGAWITCGLLLGLGLAALWLIHALQVTDDLETHANEVLSVVEHLLEHTTAAESRQRRFIISRDDRDLEGMRGEMAMASEAVTALIELTKANPHQQDLVQELSGQVATRLQYLEHGVSLAQHNQLDLDKPRPSLGPGIKAMAQVVELCRTLETTQKDILALRHSQMTQLEGSAFLTIIGLVIAGIIANLVARSVIQRSFARRQVLEDRLSEANRDLERQVAARTMELSSQARRLSEANVELESFSYSVSHDLRAPLRSIDGFSQLLIRSLPDLDPESARRLGLIRQAASRMNQLITDLLAFSKIGRTELTRCAIDMPALVQACYEELAPARLDRAIAFHCAPDLPGCQADPALLKQVVLNLLANAIKYTARSAAPAISVSWCTTAIPPSGSAPQSAYCVADNGAGFDMAYYSRLFGVFQRLHEPSDFEGTGVGLAMVKRIVERHGGMIWASGTVGAGASFYFTLEATGG